MPFMELRHLRYFVAVAEELNITRAAKRLHTSQPSLGQQVKQLEEFVGTPLLERDKRHVHLTAGGRAFLREARDILQRVDHAIEKTIRVIPKILPLMEQRLPNLTLMLHSLSTEDQIAALRKYTIDVGFLRGPIDEQDLTSEEVLREKIVVVLPAKHRLAKVKRIKFRMLDDLPCVTFSRGSAVPLRNIVGSLYKQSRLRVRSVQEADSVLGYLNMVAAGLGYGLLPEYVKWILPRNVVSRPLDYHPLPTISLAMVYRTNDKLPSLQAFKEVFHQRFPFRHETKSA
jgi:LysR family transcriptional regulator, hca operon transcriptional activator